MRECLPREDEALLSVAACRTSRQVMAGTVPFGGVAPVSVRSTTTMSTAYIDATPQQIAELAAVGCRIVRVAALSASARKC
ncbi:flavodoxin-dependent (E)-4-hydroxy-3-methylbut-2-enyl-diphosphate synthase [Streptomyces sp. NPDC005794]|uniref:flavodoxin-dependent (E)-4-hydroxy-3-methylbut-2-enyl-diphosphate synthase n=1 Tax=Streptomyces sp. NPDC005794 TaxID=3364733 RepID=UPI0036ABDD95